MSEFGVRGAGAPFSFGIVVIACGLGLAPSRAVGGQLQLNFETLDYGTTGTFITGIRGETIVGNYVIPGGTGGLLYTSESGIWTPFPVATANGVNYPDSYSASPYGPTFGSMDGILRVVGVYKTGSSPYDLGYLYDGAAAPGASLLTLIYPEKPGEPTLFTFPHSTFGNIAVGDYDTQLKTGNAFIYDIPTGTFSTNNKPGAVSTTAYGVYGDKIAGGYGAFGPDGEPGFEHGYIYDMKTDTWATYDHPGALFTHFEGITGAGRGDEYNLVADWIDGSGVHAAVLHVDADGNETWIPLEIDGATTVSANSIYQGTAVGVYTDATGVHAYRVEIPGIYNPITNDDTVIAGAPGSVAIVAGKGDDVVNNGKVRATGTGAVGIHGDTYGVINNAGKVVATGKGATAVEMNGAFGSLLNGGVVKAAKGAVAIGTGSGATGSLVVNKGVIDGLVYVAAGPDVRFENSGWLGISHKGAGTKHLVSGTYAQTADGTLALRMGGNRNDKLKVLGAARLDGAVAPIFANGGFRRHYTLVKAGDEVTGTFATLDAVGLPSFLVASLDYANSKVTLDLAAAFAGTTGLDHNQGAVAQALDDAFNKGGGIPKGLEGALFGLSDPDLPAVLDQLSGEIHASTQAVLIGQSLFTRQAILGHLREGTRTPGGGSDLAIGYAGDPVLAPPDVSGNPRQPFWAQAIGSWGSIDGDGNAATVDYSLGGVIAGVDLVDRDTWRAGLAFGYSQSSADINDPWSTADTQTGTVAGYADTSLGAWKLRAGASYGFNAIDTRRSISLGGSTSTLKADYDAGTGQVFGEVGYQAAVAGAVFEPFAGLAWVHLATEGFSERGRAGALDGSSSTANVGYSTLGVRIAGDVDAGGMVFSPRLAVAWQYAFGDLTPETAMAFAATSGAGFTVAGAPIAENAALIDAGFDFTITPKARLGLSYVGQISGSDYDSAVRGTLSWAF
ncbi:MAG: autotransporter domain-containing protein [Bauldia sp.]|nr:autotransporter domain-containing protein [Bauldia sp.]